MDHNSRKPKSITSDLREEHSLSLGNSQIIDYEHISVSNSVAQSTLLETRQPIQKVGRSSIRPFEGDTPTRIRKDAIIPVRGPTSPQPSPSPTPSPTPSQIPLQAHPQALPHPPPLTSYKSLPTITPLHQPPLPNHQPTITVSFSPPVRHSVERQPPSQMYRVGSAGVGVGRGAEVEGQAVGMGAGTNWRQYPYSYTWQGAGSVPVNTPPVQNPTSYVRTVAPTIPSYPSFTTIGPTSSQSYVRYSQ
jgi:hypothetical protein